MIFPTRSRAYGSALFDSRSLFRLRRSAACCSVPQFLHRQQGVPTETMEKDTAREFLSSEHQERLELLLFSGSPEFLPACRQLQQTAAVMPRMNAVSCSANVWMNLPFV